MYFPQLKDKSGMKNTPTEKKRNLNVSKEEHFFPHIHTVSAVASLEKVNPKAFCLFLTKILERAIFPISFSGNPNLHSNILFLEGPPGTGKTFFLENIGESILSFFNELREERKEKVSLSESDIKSRIEETLSNNGNQMDEEVIEYLSGLLAEIGSKVLLERVVIPYLKVGKDTQTLESLLIRFAEAKERGILDTLLENTNGESEPSIIVKVLPIFESGKDVVVEDFYRFPEISREKLERGESVTSMEKRQEAPVLGMLLALYSGKSPIGLFVIDEITETLKQENIPKELHDFFDSYINDACVSLTLSPHYLTEETKKTLEDLRGEVDNLLKYDERLRYLFPHFNEESLRRLLEDLRDKLSELLNTEVKTQSVVQIKIPVPFNFFVATTGNVRKEESPVGLLESTLTRLEKLYIDYPPPEKVEEFISEISRNLMSQSGLDNTHLEFFKEFTSKLNGRYRLLYQEYKIGGWVKGILPSLRTIYGLMENYIMFLQWKQHKENFRTPGLYRITYEPTTATSISGLSRFALKKLSEVDMSDVFGHKEYAEFLLNSMLTLPHIPASSFMIKSEQTGYERIEEKLTALLKTQPLKPSAPSFDEFISDTRNGYVELFMVVIGNGVFTLNKLYLAYALYTILSSFSNQRFTLYIGTTQEGKTTMASRIVPFFLRHLSNKRKVETRIIDGSSITLKATNVEVESKEGRKRIGESDLISILREANTKKDTLYIVVINEIDRTHFTQELNSLLSRLRVKLGDEEFDLSNVMFIGTMNMSTQFPDNFLSRAIVPLLFLPGLSAIYHEGQNIKNEMYLKLYIVSHMLKQGKSIKDAQKVIKELDEIIDEYYDGEDFYLRINSINAGMFMRNLQNKLGSIIRYITEGETYKVRTLLNEMLSLESSQG